MAMIKTFRRSIPSPPYLSRLVMYCPSVQANGVHAICAGNVNDRLNVSLESCAWLVPAMARAGAGGYAGIMSNALMLEHTICSGLLRI